MIASLIAGFLLASPPSLSIHVEGEGYLRLAKDGRVVYATSAKLSVIEGQLGSGGATFLPAIKIPISAEALDVDLEGNVFVKNSGARSLAGRLVLALFPANTALVAEGSFVTAAARPKLGNPGDETNGVIRAEGAKAAPVITPKDTTIPKTQSGTVKPVIQKPAKPGTVEISVRSESIVPGDTFTLGEIADIKADPAVALELAAVDMGRTPTIGVERGIDRNTVVTKLRLAKFKVDDFNFAIPNGAHVLRKGQTITFNDFLEAAKLAVKEKLGLDMPLSSSMTMPDYQAPMGDLQLVAENCIKTANSISVTVAVRVDGRRINSRTLSLTPDNAAAAGVKAGATVKIIAKLKGATIEMTGRAQQAGWIGQTVTVVTETGATQTGTVVGLNTVEVKL